MPNTQTAVNPRRLLRRGFTLAHITLDWNMVGIVVLAIAAVSAKSVALAGSDMDSLIAIGASAWCCGSCPAPENTGNAGPCEMIGGAFGLLAVYLLVQSTFVLVAGYHPRHLVPGIIWTGATALVLFGLATGKARTGAALGNQVRTTEGQVTLIDAVLAVAVLYRVDFERGMGLVVGRPGCRLRAGLLMPRERFESSFGSHEHGFAPPSIT